MIELKLRAVLARSDAIVIRAVTMYIKTHDRNIKVSSKFPFLS